MPTIERDEVVTPTVPGNEPMKHFRDLRAAYEESRMDAISAVGFTIISVVLFATCLAASIISL